MTRQIVLVGRALGAPTAERELNGLAARLCRRTGSTVRPALLDHGQRSLHDALDDCHADGAAEVLVCRGPRCSAHGSSQVAHALASRLQSGPVGYEEVLVTSTGCLVPCNLGPIVVVQPDDVWYTSVDSAGVDRIVDEHLHRGVVVGELQTSRHSEAQAAPDPSPAIFHSPPEDT